MTFPVSPPPANSGTYSVGKYLSKNFTSSTVSPLIILIAILPSLHLLKMNSSLRFFVSNSTLDDSRSVPPSPPSSNSCMPTISLFQRCVFAHSGLDTQKVYGPDGILPIVIKNCASMLTFSLGKLTRLCLSSNTLPCCWKFAVIQPVLRMGDCSQPSNYCPIENMSV